MVRSNPLSTSSPSPYANETPSNRTAPTGCSPTTGRSQGSTGSAISGSTDNTSCTRSSAAAARCPNATVIPIDRNGHTSNVTKKLNATSSPTVIEPSITRKPPTPSTPTRPTAGNSSRNGMYLARILAACSETSRMSSASVLRASIRTRSAPKPLTTRTPAIDSSTTVDNWACSACTASTAG